MEEECEECSSWEQSIYWTHFQSIHFCQILDSDFRSQLMIPKKFADYARGKLHDKITLKGPSGTTTWEVGLTKSDDLLFLRDGWSEFVNAYSLEESDILVFKYNGNSSFGTMIFDRGSLCEKESSYFIRKCGHPKKSNSMNKKGFLKEVLEEFTQEYSHEEFKPSSSKKRRKVKDGQNQNPNSVEQRIASDIPETSHVKAPCVDVVTAEDRSGNLHKSWGWEFVKPPPERRLASDVLEMSCMGAPDIEDEAAQERQRDLQKKAWSFEPVMRPPEQCISADTPEMSPLEAPYVDTEVAEDRPRNQPKSWSWEPVKLPTVNEKQKLPMKVSGINVAARGSKRAVTEEQKEATLRMARKELTIDSFLAIMRPSSVSRVFYLNIPAAWTSQHLIFKSQPVQLRSQGKTWPTQLRYRPNGRAGLTVGWKEFALKNLLEEFDVCVFKLASQKLEPVILDVSIFRVVPDAVKSRQERPL